MGADDKAQKAFPWKDFSLHPGRPDRVRVQIITLKRYTLVRDTTPDGCPITGETFALVPSTSYNQRIFIF
ncbi:hypothetical protein UR09_06140 [Candidatus Nitromaritima sp. SCGC AAA799-A02]|nr:hypothetical protein UR09_06140 [Candidatus Nitromaritima sp. SCGC AAA799-A02]